MSNLLKMWNSLFGVKQPDVVEITPPTHKPELDRVRRNLLRNVDRTMEGLERAIAVVDGLNRDLVDERMETPEGVIQIIGEIRDYKEIFKGHCLPVVNGRDRDGKLKVFFEV